MKKLEKNIKMDYIINMIAYHEEVLVTYNKVVSNAVKTITNFDDGERVERAKGLVKVGRENVEYVLKELEALHAELNEILEI